MRIRVLVVSFVLCAGGLFFGVLAARWNIFLLGQLPWGSVFIVCLLAALFCLPFSFLIFQRSAEPLRQLRREVEKIKAEDPAARLAGGALFESRQLASSITELVQRLRQRIEDLELDKVRLRTILEGMTEGVIAVDSRQYVAFANGSAGKMLDFVPDQAVGRPFYELTRFPKIQLAVEKGLASGQPHREEMVWAAGPVKHLGVHVARLVGESGGAIIVLNDTTELRRLEELRRDFVSNVSHELKTPLTVIQSNVEALLDGAVEDTEVRLPFLQRIAEQSEHLHALILDLISLARIESERGIFEFMAVSLRESAMDCVDRHRSKAEAKRIQMVESGPATLPEILVWADPEALEQIFGNLIDNAVKYTSEGGEVAISWGLLDGMAFLRIVDTGPGIPLADQARIFERFYRVDKARSRELGGTGLGLAIVKHLVQLMEGRIVLKSEVGKGTSITVLLPLAKAV